MDFLEPKMVTHSHSVQDVHCVILYKSYDYAIPNAPLKRLSILLVSLDTDKILAN